MRMPAALALLTLSVIAFPALAERCEFSADRSAEIEAATISKVVIEAGAGTLDVRGADRSAVQAGGRACASSGKLLEQIRIESRRDGDTVYVKTILPEVDASLFSVGRYAYLDLTVSVPASAAVSVDDSSGAMQLSGVRSATVTDSSGAQTVRDIAGDLDVTDSSGALHIAGVGGKLRLQDSSGDVDVNDVRGDVEVTVDSSGDLVIENVGGSVHVINDSSGDIEISDVRRDVIIDHDSSGGIHVEGVGGDFTVGADGSGSLHYDRVRGTVRLPQD